MGPIASYSKKNDGPLKVTSFKNFIKKKKFKNKIWDVGGQNIANPTMLQTYLFGAHAVLFVYDVTKTPTFENLKDWIERAKRFSRQIEKVF